LIWFHRPGRGPVAPLLAVATALALAAASARAQNLDEGKSPQKLFVDGCASCHRSPRGLAKGRFSLTLYWFLKDHYSAGPDQAKALAAYLESVDTPPPGKPAAGAKAKGASGASRAPRPPASVPAR
jgi:mono/diheme cytochrome c family protein